jgi:hypothetical protein
MVAALLNNISRSELEEITQLGQIIMNGGREFNYQSQNNNGNLMDDPERDKGEPSQQPTAEKDKDQEDKKPEIIAQLGKLEEPKKAEDLEEEVIAEKLINQDELENSPESKMSFTFDIPPFDNKDMETLSNVSPAGEEPDTDTDISSPTITPENAGTKAMVGKLQEQALKRSNAV